MGRRSFKGDERRAKIRRRRSRSFVEDVLTKAELSVSENPRRSGISCGCRNCHRRTLDCFSQIKSICYPEIVNFLTLLPVLATQPIIKRAENADMWIEPHQMEFYVPNFERKVLVLDSRYQPVKVVTLEVGFVLLYTDRAISLLDSERKCLATRHRRDCRVVHADHSWRFVCDLAGNRVCRVGQTLHSGHL